MHGSSSLVIDLALVLGVAALTSPIARALGQSTVLGYLVAGLVVGPYIPIPLFADLHRVESLAELGVVLVMFAVGLELRIAKLARVLPTAGLTGAVQVGFLMWCGYTLATALGWSTMEGLFLGASLGISSTMVVTRAFGTHVEGEVREHILGVLVVQDVLAIILLATMTGVAAGGTVEADAVTADLMRLAGVLLGMVVIGLLLVPTLVRRVAALASDEVLMVVSVGICFALAAVAAELGYSVALGAFVSGVLVAESGLGHRVETLAASMRDVFAAIFFVSIGMTVDPLQALHTLPLAIGVTAIVIVAQLVVVTLTGLVSGLGLRRSVTAGLALGQIGEFSFILAGVGIAAGGVRSDLHVLLVSVAVLTAFTTPLAIKIAPRAVSWADRAMPGPIRRTLALHEQWVLALRSGGNGRGGTGRADKIRSGVRALALDAVFVFVLAVVSAKLAEYVVPWLVGLLDIEASLARTLWFAACFFALALPVFVVAVRTTNTLASAVLEGGGGDDTHGPESPRFRALRAFLLFGLTALVGFPSATVVGASIADGRGVLLVLVVLVVLGITAFRSARDVDAEVKSAAQRFAVALTSQAVESSHDAHDHGHTEAPASPRHTLPELGATERITISADSPGRGKTLAQIDLRARTGATVIAIQRQGKSTALPNGKDLLEEGDVLLVAGTHESVEEARAALGEPSTDVPTDAVEAAS